jgi:hypothetical protein
MKIRQYLLASCISASLLSIAVPAWAQVEITDAQTTNVSTSSAGDGGTASDVTITSTGSVDVTTGSAVTVDSDNELINSGTITTTDSDDTTGILVDGTITGNVTNNNSIGLSETAPDGGITTTGTIAQGSGRTGILVSGASSFTGNIENASTGSISIQGQDSAGIRLASGSTLTGDILQSGSVNIFGENTVGLDVIGNVIGNLALGGPVSTAGENSTAVNVAGDVSGAITVDSTLVSSGYVSSNSQVLTSRQALIVRDNIEETGNVRQAGSAFSVSGNVGQGIHFRETRDADSGLLLSTSSVLMAGSAPAILIDGNGTPIAIGRVGQITDPNDPDYDAELQYAFVNQGTLTADGVLDDIDATTFSLADATLEGGISNTQGMTSTVYRSGIDPDATTPTNDAHARVIIIGGGGIAERINNTGTIFARGFEATDSIFLDPDNILAPNQVFATAIEIDADGSLSEITNLGTISAIMTARNGTAVAIRDNSGTLISLNNSGTIGSFGLNSDGERRLDTSFNLIALDLAANTAGFTLTQTAQINADTGEENTPQIVGDIFLGSGADTFDIQAGFVSGDIAFGDGADTLSLSNGSAVTGVITDGDGQLEILVADNSSLTITGPDQIDATNVTIDGTSTYSPFIDPATGETSLLNASGTVTLEDGAIIAPRLANVVDNSSTSFAIVSANNLAFDETQGSLRSDATPYLYNTVYSRSATDPNTLLLTLDLRSTSELGLDNVQAAAFTSAFEALQNSSSLGAAFTSITDQESFNAAYNQLLPEFAASSLQFILANVDGATGAVGSHLNTARQSPERPGGAWIEEFAYFADKDIAGLSDQFRGYGFGITGGFDTSFGPFQTAGLNIGFASTEIEDVLGVDEPLDVLTLQAGLYGGFRAGRLGIDLYAGGGYNDIETNRNVEIDTNGDGVPDYEANAQGDWAGTHYNASASAGYDISFGKYYVRPSATFTYLSLNENAYTEDGDLDIAQSVDSRSSNIGTVSGIVDIGTRIEKDRSWWAPALRFGYRKDVINDGVITTGRFVNGTVPYSLTSEEFPDSGIVLGVTFSSGSKYSSFSLDYDADLRDGFNRHTARLVVRMLF